MLLFLRETWELFWWAMFCPSRLQQRMNEWCPQEEKDGNRPDTSFSDILFFGNSRFTIQYLSIILIFNIPVGVAGGVAVGVAVGVVGVVAGGVAGGVAVGVAVGVAGGVAGVVAGGVAGVATLPLPWFLAFAALIAFALAPFKNRWSFIINTVTLIALSAENLGWLSALVIPVTLLSYYRIIDYILFTNISFLISFLNRFFPQKFRIIYSLPPYTSELIWLPLPNHDKFVVSEFIENPQESLKIFQHIQTFSLPGFQITLQNALPQIIADQLRKIQTIPELLFTANSDHPILPFLISPFYHLDEDSDTPTPETPLPKVKPELSILLPSLQTIVRDIQSALENQNIALRERGLERISNNLAMLKLQLPALGLKNEAIKRWTPVLERWQRVIELEQSEQRKRSQGELINPFQYGNPVRLNQKDLFKGRQRFADEVVRRVLNRDRPTLVLHGPRRCGKTSFLYNLPRLFPSDILPVFVDMQSAAITNKESDFCYGLVRAIHKDCKSQGVQLPTLPKREQFENSPYTNLEDWLDTALEQIGEKRILLNLDEFEKIGTAIQEGKLSLHLFDQLRHLIQHYDQLGFLFSGVQTLEELGPNWSSYFISVVPIEMVYLEPHEAEELLLNPDPAFKLRYDTGIVEELLKITNCHPYCLQLLGASMVNQANFNRTDLITPELLQAAINEAFTSGEPYFTNIWTEFTGTNPEEITIGQDLLLQVAKTDNLIFINTPIAKKVLTRLVRYHILQEINGVYDFEVPLLKQWVRKRAVKS
ncbi:MAG: AAA family ATPase [Cuspidothrix sp.]